MALTQKPTLVYGPGAWHRAETWDKLIALTGAKGFKGVAVTLPSTVGNRAATYGDDVKAVQEAIRAETT
jgi:hypothetical protein